MRKYDICKRHLCDACKFDSAECNAKIEDMVWGMDCVIDCHEFSRKVEEANEN